MVKILSLIKKKKKEKEKLDESVVSKELELSTKINMEASELNKRIELIEPLLEQQFSEHRKLLKSLVAAISSFLIGKLIKSEKYLILQSEIDIKHFEEYISWIATTSYKIMNKEDIISGIRVYLKKLQKDGVIDEEIIREFIKDADKELEVLYQIVENNDIEKIEMLKINDEVKEELKNLIKVKSLSDKIKEIKKHSRNIEAVAKIIDALVKNETEKLSLGLELQLLTYELREFINNPSLSFEEIRKKEIIKYLSLLNNESKKLVQELENLKNSIKMNKSDIGEITEDTIEFKLIEESITKIIEENIPEIQANVEEYLKEIIK